MRVPVAITIPIYNAYDDLVRCIDSVLAHADGDFELILVDDASDDPRMTEYLQKLSQTAANIRIIRNETNIGFVQSANRGMRESKGRDILLLNSDTIVSGDFISHLQACAYHDEQTGIVCPFSNNATICSIPNFCENNPLPDQMTLDAYNDAIARSSLKEYPKIPTAVGFCMYIRAEVIEHIGYFDEAFGRGFGEENDFAERAKQHGFSIRLCDNLFVAHTGKASFGTEGWELSKKHSRLLLKHHPGYERELSEFCAANPLRKVQENARYHTLRYPGLLHASVLFLIHRDPFSATAGGAENHLRDLIQGLKLPRCLIVHSEGMSIIADEIFNGDFARKYRHCYEISRPVRDCESRFPEVQMVLEQITEDFSVAFAHIHHLINWPLNIWRVFHENNIPYFFTTHDYMCICPNLNLIDFKHEKPCLCSNDEEQVQFCLSTYRQTLGRSYDDTSLAFLESYRREFREMLEAAQAVFCPSKRTLEIVLGFYPSLSNNAITITHGYTTTKSIAKKNSIHSSLNPKTLKVAVLGNVSHPIKGAAQYLKAVQLSKRDPIEWHFFGDLRESGFDQKLKQAGQTSKLFFHGNYKREHITELLHSNNIDIAVFFALSEETFSYTFSELLIAGLPVICSNRGAFVERLEELGMAELLIETPEDACSLLIRFQKERDKVRALKERLSNFAHKSIQENAAEYKEKYGNIVQLIQEPCLAYDFAMERRNFSAYWRACSESFLGDKLLNAPIYSTHKYLRLAAQQASSWLRFLPDSLLSIFLFNKTFERLLTFNSRDIASTAQFSADIPRQQSLGKQNISIGVDPYMVLPWQRIESAAVDLIRVRLKLLTEQKPLSRFYWLHEGDEDFSEAKSLAFNLEKSGIMQDILIDLRTWEGRERWLQGVFIERFRFDPMEGRGEIIIDEITLLRKREK